MQPLNPALSAEEIELLWAGQEDVADRLVAAILKMNRMGAFADPASGA